MKTITCDFCSKDVVDGLELALRLEYPHYPSLPMIWKTWDICNECVSKMRNQAISITVAPPVMEKKVVDGDGKKE